MSASDGLGSHAGPRSDMGGEVGPAKGDSAYGYSGSAIMADMTSTFAAVLLLVMAGIEALQGISRIANDQIFAVTPEYIFKFDTTTWGWIHLLVSVFALFIAIGILKTQSWALVSGVVIAVLSTLANFASMPFMPWWSLTVIIFNFVLIWALCTRRAYPD